MTHVALPALWPNLNRRRILLGVGGGVAAYKAAELCRLLVRCGAEVRVAMTAAARRFVGETTFAALSGQTVATDLFDPVQEAQIGHIRLAEEAEAYVVAPATANLLAALASGLAPDVVTTAYLAFTGPVLIAPAMNVNMWEHAATQRNVALLRERGHSFVGPGTGEMACGYIGNGRMAEPEEVLQSVWGCLAPKTMVGRRVLVTAGPTREAIDPVRFLGNRSSGKMGYALAAEAAARGALVTLISGPTVLPALPDVKRVDVVSAKEMAQAVRARAADHDVVIMAAAVADYRVAEVAPAKLHKEQWGPAAVLQLERTEDILAGLGADRRHAAVDRPLLVGFAAETGIDDEQVMRKLEAKGCDILVVNDVNAHDAGFDVDTNRVVIIGRDGRKDALVVQPKRDVASHILDRVARELDRGDQRGEV